jgi:hypothetical protein
MSPVIYRIGLGSSGQRNAEQPRDQSGEKRIAWAHRGERHQNKA